MSSIHIPIYWKDLTPECQKKVEKYLKSGGVNVTAWTNHFMKSKFPVTDIVLNKTEDGDHG